MSEDIELQEQLAALDIQSRILLSEADLGDEGDEFLHTNLGRTVLGMAMQEYAELVIQLQEVRWWQFGRLMDLQNRIRRVKMFPSYLQELILRGRHAKSALADAEES